MAPSTARASPRPAPPARSASRAAAVAAEAGTPVKLRAKLSYLICSDICVPHDGVLALDVPAGGETRLDWRVKVVKEGRATITVKALTDEESDAMAMKFPAYIHGMLQREA